MFVKTDQTRRRAARTPGNEPCGPVAASSSVLTSARPPLRSGEPNCPVGAEAWLPGRPGASASCQKVTSAGATWPRVADLSLSAAPPPLSSLGVRVRRLFSLVKPLFRSGLGRGTACSPDAAAVGRGAGRTRGMAGARRAPLGLVLVSRCHRRKGREDPIDFSPLQSGLETRPPASKSPSTRPREGSLLSPGNQHGVPLPSGSRELGSSRCRQRRLNLWAPPVLLCPLALAPSAAVSVPRAWGALTPRRGRKSTKEMNYAYGTHFLDE